MNNKGTRKVTGFRAYVAEQYEKRTGIKLQGKRLDAFMASPHFTEIRTMYADTYNKMNMHLRAPYIKAQQDELSKQGNSGGATDRSQGKPQQQNRTPGWSVLLPGGSAGFQGPFGKGVIEGAEVDMSKVARDGTPRNVRNGRIRGVNEVRTGKPIRVRPTASKYPNRITYGQGKGRFTTSAARANYANRMDKIYQAASQNNHAALKMAGGGPWANSLSTAAGMGTNYALMEAANRGNEAMKDIMKSPYSPHKYKDNYVARGTDFIHGVTTLDGKKIAQAITGDDGKGNVPPGYFINDEGKLELYKGKKQQTWSNSPFYNVAKRGLEMPVSFLKENAVYDPYTKQFWVRPYRREDYLDTYRMPGVPDTVSALYYQMPMRPIDNLQAKQLGLMAPGNEVWDQGELPGVEVVARRPRKPVAPRPKPAPAPAPIQQAPPLQAIPHPGMPNIGMPANLPSLAPAMPTNDPVYIHNNQQGMMNPGGAMDWDEIQQMQPPAAKGSYGYFFN